MKVITLLPVKNEAWILHTTLTNMSVFSDHIVIADQHSTDGSLNLYKTFPKVEIIENNNTTHNNSVRWQLLDYARERFGVNNLIVCIDADEMIQPVAIEYIKTQITNTQTSFSFTHPWIQLWGSIQKHRVDSVWKDNYKSIIFFDNGKIDYQRTTVLNDHTARVPQCQKDIKLDRFPLLHYQYIHLQQAEIKQAWYRCSERISGNAPKKINHKYAVAMNTSKVVLESTPIEWLQDLPQVSYMYVLEDDWRYREILSWFNTYGVDFFEPLEIWHISQLYEIFTKKHHREPKTQTYAKWLVILNNIKHIFKK